MLFNVYKFDSRAFSTKFLVLCSDVGSTYDDNRQKAANDTLLSLL